jgi:hypothetical protein
MYSGPTLNDKIEYLLSIKSQEEELHNIELLNLFQTIERLVKLDSKDYSYDPTSAKHIEELKLWYKKKTAEMGNNTINCRNLTLLDISTVKSILRNID